MIYLHISRMCHSGTAMSNNLPNNTFQFLQCYFLTCSIPWQSTYAEKYIWIVSQRFRDSTLGIFLKWSGLRKSLCSQNKTCHIFHHENSSTTLISSKRSDLSSESEWNPLRSYWISIQTSRLQCICLLKMGYLVSITSLRMLGMMTDLKMLPTFFCLNNLPLRIRSRFLAERIKNSS